MTTRLAIFSDLHLDVCDSLLYQEPWHSRSWAEGVDLAIVAGDVAEQCMAAHYLCRLLPEDLPTIFVPGNHEAYGGTIDGTNVEIGRALKGRLVDVTMLVDRAVEIGDLRIVGSTLWSDFRRARGDILSLAAIHQTIVDFRQIYHEDGQRLVVMTDLAERHLRAREFLAEELARERAGKKLVFVTHFAPVGCMTLEHFRTTPETPYFVADMDAELEHIGMPDLWVCGHTHARLRRTIGDCRFVNWCRGYPGEFTEPFAPLILEV